MTSDEPPAQGGDAGDDAWRLPFGVTVAHQARMYDYVLGGWFR